MTNSTKTHPYTPGQNTPLDQAENAAYATAHPVTTEFQPAPHQQQQYCAAQVSNPNYVPMNSRKPVMMTYCPSCAKEQARTRTRTKATGTTWICVGAGFFIFWPLCWLPLVIKPMKQTNHYCQNCNRKVGRVKPFQ